MSGIPLDTVDWERMAEPQPDQYDTRVTLAVATTSGSPLRPEPYVRRSSAGLPTIPGTNIAIRVSDDPALEPPRFAPAPSDHPNLPKALVCLRSWPEGYAQFLFLVDSVHPYVDLQIPEELRGIAGGSSSHSHERCFGTLSVTLDNPIDCAHALVRELAHQKLRALGVSYETAWRLVTNDPSELFPSPLRRSTDVPMTAVLHALYAFLYLIELGLHMLAGEGNSAHRDHLLRLLLRNVVRTEAGYETLVHHVRTDYAGAQFVRTFLFWARHAIERGYDALAVNGYEARVGRIRT